MQPATSDQGQFQQEETREERIKRTRLENLAKAQEAKRRKVEERKEEIRVVPLVQHTMREPIVAERSRPREGYAPRDRHLYDSDWELPERYERSAKPKRKREVSEPIPPQPNPSVPYQLLSSFGSVVTTGVSLLAVALVPIIVGSIQSRITNRPSSGDSSFFSSPKPESPPDFFAGQSIFR